MIQPQSNPSLGTFARFFSGQTTTSNGQAEPKQLPAKVTAETRAAIILLANLLDKMAMVMSATFEPKSRNRREAAEERESEFLRCRELIRKHVVMDPEDDRRPYVVKATPEADLKRSRPQFKDGKKVSEGGELVGTAIRAWIRLLEVSQPIEAVPVISEGVEWLIESEEGIYEAAGSYDSIIVRPFSKEGVSEDQFQGYHVFCPVELADEKLLKALEDTMDEKLRPGYNHIKNPIGKPGTRKMVFKKTMDKQGKRQGTTLIGKKWSKNVISAAGSQVPPNGTYMYRYTEGWTAFVVHFLGTLDRIDTTDTVTVLDVAAEMDPWAVLGINGASADAQIVNERVEELLSADPDESHPTRMYLIDIGVLKPDDESKVQVTAMVDALQSAKDKALSELNRLWSEVTGQFNSYPTVAELTSGDITLEAIKEATSGENPLTTYIASKIGFFGWELPICVYLYHWLITKAKAYVPIAEEPVVSVPKTQGTRPIVKYDGKVNGCRPAFDCCELLDIQSTQAADILAELTMVPDRDPIHATLVLNEALKAKDKTEMTEADTDKVSKVMNTAKAAVFTAMQKLIAATPAPGEAQTTP